MHRYRYELHLWTWLNVYDSWWSTVARDGHYKCTPILPRQQQFLHAHSLMGIIALHSAAVSWEAGVLAVLAVPARVAAPALHAAAAAAAAAAAVVVAAGAHCPGPCAALGAPALAPAAAPALHAADPVVVAAGAHCPSPCAVLGPDLRHWIPLQLYERPESRDCRFVLWGNIVGREFKH